MEDRSLTISAFHEFLKENKLVAAKCNGCGILWLPPRLLCAECHSDNLCWKELSGKGKLISYTVIGFGTMPMLKAGYDRKNPYCIGIVEVEEGPRMSAQILGVDVLNPESIKVGAPVQVEFVERESWHFVREVADIKKTYAAFRVQ